MRICFFTKYEVNQASSRERIGAYLEFLNDRGHTYRIISVIPNKLRRLGMGQSNFFWLFYKLYCFWYSGISRYLKCLCLISTAKGFNLIVIQKVNLPYILLRLLRARNKNIIFDFDDLCFFYPDSERISVCQRLKLAWRLWYQNPNVLRLFKHIIAGNEYLAKISKDSQQPAVTVIPTAVDCNLYFPGIKNNNSPLIIGFSGAGENHLENLKLLVRPLNTISKTYPIIFKLIGAMHSKKIKSMFCSGAYKFICIDWLSVNELPEAIRSFDIGVMPLVDDNQAKGKCGFKALLYMASAVATVASPVGVIRDIIQDGINGLWAKGEDEWIEKLLLLIENKDLRRNLAIEGRKTVERSYSLRKISDIFINTLESVSNVNN
ncbi:MAG: glycosyltransferase family 4 protein [Candidatus Omnitrophota bacterium]